MKKILLALIISLFFVAEASSIAQVSQSAYRWRNDDGNETTATWKADENIPLYHEGSDALRLRLQTANIDEVGTFTSTVSLFYSLDPNSSNWTEVTADAGNAFVVTTSPYVSNGDPTSENLTPPPLKTFKAGFISTSFDQFVSLDPDEYSEHEWVIQPTANADPDIYFFKMGWPFTIFTTSGTFTITGVPEGNSAVLYYETPLMAVPLHNWAIYLGLFMAMGFVLFMFYKHV